MLFNNRLNVRKESIIIHLNLNENKNTDHLSTAIEVVSSGDINNVGGHNKLMDQLFNLVVVFVGKHQVLALG